MTKQTTRKLVAQNRAALSSAARNQANAAIQSHLLQSKAWQQASTIFTFMSMQTEVDTHALIQQAWAQGKQVAVPVTQAGGQMVFVGITPQTPLFTTKYGTQEPALPQTSAISQEPALPQEPAPTTQPTTHILTPAATDLFLVPGLVFDAQGNRYGYGGGFYDRYLAKHPHATPIALAFALQLSSTPLEPQPHDIPMQAIVTEHGWRMPNIPKDNV